MQSGSNPTENPGAFGDSEAHAYQSKSKAYLETTLTGKFKTDIRMPTQVGPLEGRAVDNPGGRDETSLSEMLPGNIGESKVAHATSHKVRKDPRRRP